MLDVHKMQITVSIRICAPGAAPQLETRAFDALASGLDEMIAWLRERQTDAAVMEGTGIYWLAPFEALEAAGIPVTLVNAHQVKQLKGRKTDVADSVWLARVRQFGLASPSYVPPKTFREIRVLTRYRHTLVGQRSRVRNRVHKILDRSGVRVGGVLSDVFGTNGRRILDGLLEGLDREEIVASLSHHVRHKVERLDDALRLSLSPVDLLLLSDLLRSGRTNRGARWGDREWPPALGGPHRPPSHHPGNQSCLGLCHSRRDRTRPRRVRFERASGRMGWAESG